jgi:hypothetical protein
MEFPGAYFGVEYKVSRFVFGALYPISGTGRKTSNFPKALSSST